MMNIDFPFLPERAAKPRKEGLTMMMDKGISIREAENFVDAAGEYTDFVKIAFGSAVFAKNIEQKLAIYRSAQIRPHFGGTFFEAFVIRGMFEDFRRFLDKYKMEVVEVSDGSIKMEEEDKLHYIEVLSKQATVISEVGSKMSGTYLTNEQWVASMQRELSAGSWKVIAEARESGTIGIYNSDGSANKQLIKMLLEDVGNENILWEAPTKSQQAWFIKQLGANVSLGNVATGEVVALETLRLGLRGDTFFEFLPESLQKFRQL